MDTCPEHQLPTLSDVPGSPVANQSPKRTPDSESSQADSCPGSGSFEPGQPEKPDASHGDEDLPPGEVVQADPYESDSDDSPEAFFKWI